VRIGLFGGSFNPIHIGHLIAARSVAEQLGLEKVYLIPAAAPPHKLGQDLAGPEHRWQMVCLAAAPEPLFEPSDCELHRQGPSYTILTVAQFRERLGSAAELHWIIGADSLPDLVNWYQAERLLETCKIVTAARPGWDRIDTSVLARRFNPLQVDRLVAGILQTPRIEISGTDIRRRVAGGLSIRHLVPDAVADYISEHRLYRAEPG